MTSLKFKIPHENCHKIVHSVILAKYQTSVKGTNEHSNERAANTIAFYRMCDTLMLSTSDFRNFLHLSGKQDLNLRPQRPERRALPTALLPEKNCKFKLHCVAGSDHNVPNPMIENPLKKMPILLNEQIRERRGSNPRSPA